MEQINAIELGDKRVDFTEPQSAETSCWNCGRSYAMSAAVCPDCQAANANRDLARAQTEQQAQFLGHDDEGMARYSLPGGL